MPNGDVKTVEILEVRDREPTCRKCGKKIRFASSNGKQFPIMINSDTDQYEAHFNCKP